MEERQRRMQNAPKVAPNQQKLTPRDLPIRSNIGNVEFDDEVEISDDDEEEDISDEEEEEEEEMKKKISLMMKIWMKKNKYTSSYTIFC